MRWMRIKESAAEFGKVMQKAWEDTPDDAARILFVAVLMPVAFSLYQVTGLLGGGLTVARIVFAASLGILGFGVGCLIHERRREWGMFILAVSIATAIAAITVAIVAPDAVFGWRSLIAGLQASITAGWGVLWVCRRRWLSRTLARWSFLISAAGFALYLITNFGVRDPMLSDPLSWGISAARSVAMRVIGQPVDVALGLVLWALLGWTWCKWHLRDRPPAI